MDLWIAGVAGALAGFALAALFFAHTLKRRKVIAAEEAERIAAFMRLIRSTTQAETEDAASVLGRRVRRAG